MKLSKTPLPVPQASADKHGASRVESHSSDEPTLASGAVSEPTGAEGAVPVDLLAADGVSRALPDPVDFLRREGFPVTTHHAPQALEPKHHGFYLVRQPQPMDQYALSTCFGFMGARPMPNLSAAQSHLIANGYECLVWNPSLSIEPQLHVFPNKEEKLHWMTAKLEELAEADFREEAGRSMWTKIVLVQGKDGVRAISPSDGDEFLTVEVIGGDNAGRPLCSWEGTLLKPVWSVLVQEPIPSSLVGGGREDLAKGGFIYGRPFDLEKVFGKGQGGPAGPLKASPVPPPSRELAEASQPVLAAFEGDLLRAEVLGMDRSQAEILGMVGHSDPLVRRDGMERLSRHEEALRLLTLLLQSPKASARKAAALCAVGMKQGATEILTPLVRDKDPEVRYDVALAASRRTDCRGVLLSLQFDTEEQVASMARRGLAVI